MNNDDAKKCLCLLTDRFGIHFQCELKNDVIYPEDTFVSDEDIDRFRPYMFVVVNDEAMDIVNMKIGNPMTARDDPPGFRKYEKTPGFTVKLDRKDYLGVFAEMLSGVTLESDRKTIRIPVFSSYEELTLKLSV